LDLELQGEGMRMMSKVVAERKIELVEFVGMMGDSLNLMKLTQELCMVSF
jgi:hypothetical protein